MKLDPGLYILRTNELIPTYAYLEVYYQGKQLYYTINGGIPSMSDKYSDIPIYGYRFVKKITKPLIKRVKFHIEWIDHDENDFKANFCHVNEIREFFSKFPEIARAFGSKKY